MGIPLSGSVEWVPFPGRCPAAAGVDGDHAMRRATQRITLGSYLSLAGAGLTAALVALGGLGPAQIPGSRAGDLFEARPVDPERYAVLGRPLGNGEWTLLVLEQIRPAPLCWQRRPDGLVDPSLNRFDFTGICGRYIDSNGFSVRLANLEGSSLPSGPLRLRLEQSGTELQLLASAAGLANELLVGRAAIPARDRDGFVALRLNPGWELQRRRYGSQTLNHLYFANAASAEQLLAYAGGRPTLPGGTARAAYPMLPPPPPLPVSTAPAPRSSWRTQAPIGAPGMAMAEPTGMGEGRVVALQVVPFRE